MLTGLRLSQFRCYTEHTLTDLGPKVAFVGENGRGKTSLLEAIYFCCDAVLSAPIKHAN
ncbi:MAG: AAA family ATPase [Blastochloris sp.]|nr:AAA family ATPase [Blastochloris sp.]